MGRGSALARPSQPRRRGTAKSPACRYIGRTGPIGQREQFGVAPRRLTKLSRLPLLVGFEFLERPAAAGENSDRLSFEVQQERAERRSRNELRLWAIAVAQGRAEL